MSKAERSARATWKGNLLEGAGEIVSTGSGAISALPISWKARTQGSQGMTNPEELLAAAHAACYCMAVSNQLASAGYVADQLEVTAVCTFEYGDGARVSAIHLDLRADVPGIEEQSFAAAAEAARSGCPISKALSADVEIRLTSHLVA